MGKIAGVLLGMMMIGNNSTLHQTLGGGAQQKPQSLTPDPQRDSTKAQPLQAPQPVVVYAPEEERAVIHRSR